MDGGASQGHKELDMTAHTHKKFHCVYIYIYIYIYTHVCVCVTVCPIFFIHLSVEGHLGCFHILAVVNSAAMNIQVHVFDYLVLIWVHIIFYYLYHSFWHSAV